VPDASPPEKRWRAAAARELPHQPRHLRSNGDHEAADGPAWLRDGRRDRPEDTDDGDDRDGPERTDDGEQDEDVQPRRRWRRTILEWLGVIGGGIVIALLVEAFLIQAFWIPSESMEPTLHIGDRVLVNKLSYNLHDVHRGDVIVFERPPVASSQEDGEIKDLIKRVIAVEGDTIEGRDGEVYVNGDRIEEDYLEPGTPTTDLEEETIKPDHVFVMGDNRTNSEDSRVFGQVPEDDIVGRAFVRVLPITDIGWL
jgi:signal peptidase I